MLNSFFRPNQIRKIIIKLHKNAGCNTDIVTNPNIADFIDMTLNLIMTHAGRDKSLNDGLPYIKISLNYPLNHQPAPRNS